MAFLGLILQLKNKKVRKGHRKMQGERVLVTFMLAVPTNENVPGVVEHFYVVFVLSQYPRM